MNFYVCSSPYHVFIALLKIFNSDNQAVLYLSSTDESVHNYFNQLLKRKSQLPNKVAFVYVEPKQDSQLKKVLFANKFRKDVYNQLNATKNDITYILFPWNQNILYTAAKYWFDKAKHIELVEEGANAYDTPYPKFYKKLIKSLLGYNHKFYLSDKVKQILVQYPEKYELLPKDKLVYLDIKKLQENLSDDEKIIITRFLGSTSLIGENVNDTILLLTQPLSEDGYISEAEKIQRYDEIIKERLLLGKRIIIKKHPRDKTTYRFERVEILEGQVPSEIFNLLGLKFYEAVSISSSAVFNINANNKVIVEPDFFNNKRL